MGIKRFVKRSTLLSSAAFAYRKMRCKAYLNRYSKLPLDSNKVFFYRSDGAYGDNARAVAEYLHEHYPQIKLVWACEAQFVDRFPPYVTPVIRESADYFKALATAGAWVCCSTLPNSITKRDGQLYIQTWHGDKFLKKIANDAAADIDSYKWRKVASDFCESRICDYFVTGCEWFVPIAASAFGYKGAMLRSGMPRNDRLVDLDESECRRIKAELGIPEDVRVLIYAPTFRDYNSTQERVDSDIDLIRIVDELEKKYSCKWICLTRAHAGRLLRLNNGTISDSRFMDVTTYPDMADLLMISDMLISDYSSCAADFALTGRMVLMYQDDIDMYTTKGRTLYFDMDDSPYWHVKDMDGAIDVIRRATDESIKQNSRAIIDFYDSFEYGHASRTVSEVIIDSLNRIENNNH